MFGSSSDSLGTLLRCFRTRRHLTQQQLAATIGVHRTTIGRWEEGSFLPESKALVLDLARHLHLSDQETCQLLEASLTALTPYWYVPLPRNPYFTGREEILETLHTQLSVDQAVELTQSSALYGLGGVGKTQAALEYAYRHALEYSAVFWVSAETEESMIASLHDIAETLQLPEQEEKNQQHVVAAVQRWLSTHGRWLLIWDDVKDLEMLDRFLLGIRSGAILITTPCRTLGTFTRGLELLPMEQEEGILFLLLRMKMLEPKATYEDVRQVAESRPTEYAMASELVTLLGGLPLALDQAGAYLEATQCGLATYLELFRIRRAALLQQRGEGAYGHRASVFTTFTLAIMATAQRHPAVRDLLQVCALLHPDAIPEEIFRQGGAHLGATLEAICRDALEWNQVVSAACAYSLLSRQPGQQALSMHRLLQAVLLDAMTEAERRRWIRRVISALDAAFSKILLVTEHTAWRQEKRLLPHTQPGRHRDGIAEETSALASLASRVAQYPHACESCTEAKLLFQSALHIREQTLGPGHPDEVSLLNNLTLLWSQGKYAERCKEELSDVFIIEGAADKEALVPHKAVDLSSPQDDPLRAFLDVCCEQHPRAWCRSSDIWQAYERWSREHHERYPLSRRAFVAQLKVHGCRADRTKTARIWRGIALVKTCGDRR
jgi:DNA-binding XRE family transcriptional regulator